MSENNVINLETKKAEMESISEVETKKDNITEENQTVTNPEEKVEITMLEYVNGHFDNIRDVLNENNRIIHMIDRMNFSEMCKLEAVITLLVEKLGITQDEFIEKYKEILNRYQENVKKEREEENKNKADVKNITEEEANDIREKIKADVGSPETKE